MEKPGKNGASLFSWFLHFLSLQPNHNHKCISNNKCCHCHHLHFPTILFLPHVSQSIPTYDALGRVVMNESYQRNPDATGTGALTTSNAHCTYATEKDTQLIARSGMGILHCRSVTNPLTRWLDDFLNADRFRAIMVKYPPWQPGQDQVVFP